MLLFITFILLDAYSPGGICYERYPNVPDDVVDCWHPLEKARYPHYFAKREAAKEAYAKLYEKRWGINPIEALGITHHVDVEDPQSEEEKMYGKGGHFGNPIPVTEDKQEKKH